MTEEKLYTKLGYDWHKLELYETAHEFFSRGDEKGIGLAKKSLELFLKDKDIESSDPISMTLTDPQVIAKTIQNGLKVYMEGYLEQTVRDIVNYNENIFNDYAGERAGEFKEKLKPFYDMKYSDILKEMKKAKNIIEGEEFGRSSKRELESAKKNHDKYMKIYKAINLLEGERKEGLRRKVEKFYNKESFNSLFDSEEGESEVAGAA